MERNLRFWPIRALTLDINCRHLHRDCYNDPINCGPWVLAWEWTLARDTSIPHNGSQNYRRFGNLHDMKYSYANFHVKNFLIVHILLILMFVAATDYMYKNISDTENFQIYGTNTCTTASTLAACTNITVICVCLFICLLHVACMFIVYYLATIQK